MGFLSFMKRPKITPLEIIEDPKISVQRKVEVLENCDYEEYLAYAFSLNVRAQDISLEVFRRVVNSGERRAVSGFLHSQPQKGDYLDFAKINFMLRQRGLRFLHESGRYIEINSGGQRSVKIIKSFADIDAGGLMLLALDKTCGMVMIATRPATILMSEQLMRTVAEVTGYSRSEVKAFCKSPKYFSAACGSQSSKADENVLRELVGGLRVSEKPAAVV
jgi:hypothetical protein